MGPAYHKGGSHVLGGSQESPFEGHPLFFEKSLPKRLENFKISWFATPGSTKEATAASTGKETGQTGHEGWWEWDDWCILSYLIPVYGHLWPFFRGVKIRFSKSSSKCYGGFLGSSRKYIRYIYIYMYNNSPNSVVTLGVLMVVVKSRGG